MDGKPWCACGERKLTRLSDNMLSVWSQFEGERCKRCCQGCFYEGWVFLVVLHMADNRLQPGLGAPNDKVSW